MLGVDDADAVTDGDTLGVTVPLSVGLGVALEDSD